MPSSRTKYYSLRRRIVWQFCLFTFILSGIFGFLSIVLMYTLEDLFIESDVVERAKQLSSHYQANGKWPDTTGSNMQLHFSVASFPEDIKAEAQQHPRRKEFFGDEGRHYHVHHFDAHPDTFLVAEVSDKLLVRKMRSGVIQLLAISGVVVSLLACLLAWFIGRKTVKPLEQLALLVDDVEPEDIPKDFAQQFPKNEIGILAQTLERTFAQILAALEREKCFTRDASHELRTPLAVIKNAVEVARAKNTDTNEQSADSALLDRIYDAADQMQRTVQTLLILAREEHARNREPLSSVPLTPLMPLIEKSILDNHLLLKGKPVEVTVSDSCDVQIAANPDMLKVLLDNLLSNAFQYTEKGEVSIAYTENKMVIKDTGPGIEAEISERILTSGVKGQQSAGFGFGLSIVKRLCEHQGWKMNVQSGSGTTVYVAFS